MKVLMTADTVGGVWTYSIDLVRELAHSGVQVALATMGAPLTAQQWQDARVVPGLEVFESSYRLEWMSDPWDDIALAGDWLLDLEARIRPQVVHLNGYAHGSLPWRAPVLVVGHSCVLSWWSAVKGEPAPAEWNRYAREVARGLRTAWVVAGPTAAMLGALEYHYGPIKRGVVVPNGRSSPLLVPGEKEPYILSAGRVWDEAKNVVALSRVAGQLPWPVYVAGDNRHPSGGEASLDNVRALGPLSGGEVASWLAGASIYALPARYEPFGLSAVEAGLAGCALVLGDIPSLREVWGDTALFVPPDDTEALAAALQVLIADPELRSEMAERARRRALEFTPARMAEGYLAIYRGMGAGEVNGYRLEGDLACTS